MRFELILSDFQSDALTNLATVPLFARTVGIEPTHRGFGDLVDALPVMRKSSRPSSGPTSDCTLGEIQTHNFGSVVRGFIQLNYKGS